MLVLIFLGVFGSVFWSYLCGWWFWRKRGFWIRSKVYIILIGGVGIGLLWCINCFYLIVLSLG
ncbi:MAG: hypothetical protein CMK09_11385 [Ponticaulis sp.]|nr:hypothetical protein [Ponticaulis sp.]